MSLNVALKLNRFVNVTCSCNIRGEYLKLDILASAKDDKDCTLQKSNTALSKSLWAVTENGKQDFSLWINIFLLPSVTKNLLTQSHLVKPCKLVVLVDDLGHLGHHVHALPPQKRMKMMAGQRSPKTRPTTLSQQGSTVLSRSRNIIYYVITVVENNKDIMKITVHGELNIYFSFHGK